MTKRLLRLALAALFVFASMGIASPALALPSGASISGTLTSTASGSSYRVLVRDLAGNAVGAASVTTPASFTVGDLPAGDYRLFFESIYPDGRSEYWPDAYTTSAATVFHLAAGQQVTGIHAVVAKRPRITGVVTGGGAPIRDVRVWTSDFAGTAVTDGSGKYSLYLDPGTYRLRFVPDPYSVFSGGWASLWLGGSAFVEGSEEVVLGETDVVRDMTLPPESTISGRIERNGSTDPVSVSAWAWNGEIGAWDRAPAGIARVDTRDEYVLDGLPSGTYRVRFESRKYSTQDLTKWRPAYWDDAGTFEEAAVVELGVDDHVDGIDVVMRRYGIDVARVSGADRFVVAASMASAFEGTDTVVIANGLNYPDALSAGPYAALLGAPLLLVAPNAIPVPVLEVLDQIDPDHVIIVGGPASVSPAVAAQLDARYGTVERIGGPDRFAVSRSIAERFIGLQSSLRGPRVAYLTTGLNFPDALSAGPPAAMASAPLIAVDGTRVTADSATLALLEALEVDVVHIVGGPGSVSPGWAESLVAHGYDIDRYGGADRYEASFNVNFSFGFTGHSDYGFLAVGTTFPDALAGSALAGHLGSPLWVVPGHCVPPKVLADIVYHGLDEVILLGGPASLSSAVERLEPCSGPN